MLDRWKRISLGLALSFTSANAYAGDIEIKRVERPPQYIMIGFDGGLDLNQWQATRNFASEMKNTGRPVNFTYFLSGVYFLRNINRHFYAPPKHDVGYSAIGFAKNATDINNRINMMNDSYAEGHEIASKGNGHFNAAAERWSEEDWRSELKQFRDFIFNSYFNNALTPNEKYPQGFAFGEKDIVGFRAPFLATNESLWPTLKELGFKYDTSISGEMTTWPNQDVYGVWRINIPMVEMAGTGKRIIGMDYNFYMAQSRGKEDLANREVYRKQMFDTYMNYFNLNYYGRRAPLNIGHHFSLYNGGAYWEALQDFVKTVCGMPEVQCVSMKSYVSWLESLTPEALQAYRTGQFDLMPRARRTSYSPERFLDVQLNLQTEGNQLVANAYGNDLTSDMKVVLKVNDEILKGTSVSLNSIRNKFAGNSSVEVYASVINGQGREVQSATYKMTPASL